MEENKPEQKEVTIELTEKEYSTLMNGGILTFEGGVQYFRKDIVQALLGEKKYELSSLKEENERLRAMIKEAEEIGGYRF
jgi:hypothetical protein